MISNSAQFRQIVSLSPLFRPDLFSIVFHRLHFTTFTWYPVSLSSVIYFRLFKYLISGFIGTFFQDSWVLYSKMLDTSFQALYVPYFRLRRYVTPDRILDLVRTVRDPMTGFFFSPVSINQLFYVFS